MAEIETRGGDIFEEDVDAIVNTVNCAGVMGKGLALQFRRKFEANFDEYKRACDHGEVRIGKMFVTERPPDEVQLDFFDTLPTSDEDNEPRQPTGMRPKWIINFPTKKHWRSPSRLDYIDDGLVDLVKVIKAKNIESIAIPALGCDLGGLDWGEVEPMIRKAIGSIDGLRAVLLRPYGWQPRA